MQQNTENTILQQLKKRKIYLEFWDFLYEGISSDVTLLDSSRRERGEEYSAILGDCNVCLREERESSTCR